MGADQPHAAPSTPQHVAVLAVLCLLTFFPGLDHHGVTNWQEGQRLLVARDMQAAGQWLVPTVHGQPYLAKPPMVYWAQLALAGAMGQWVELWHLRFVVALAGLLGVLATYGAARELLTPDRPTAPQRASGARAAFWSAALLATGILYVRAARIGELDILLVPFVALAVWSVARAFRAHRTEQRTHIPAVLAAAATTTGAVLTKDPGLAYVALAAYGGIALWYACTRDPLDTSFLWFNRGNVPSPAPQSKPWLARAGAVLVGCAFFLAAAINLRSIGELPGPLLIGAAGAWLGWVLARLLQPRRAMATFAAFSRTHPLLVLGPPVAARFGWAWLVAQCVGADQTAALAQAEVDDNIRPFIAEAPINNFETLLFGLGIGSVLAFIAAFVLLRTRPRLTPGAAIIAAWIILSLIVFSILGKGVQRYLTPMWPAWAMLAGVLASRWCDPRPMQRPRSLWLGAAVLVLASAQSAQYGLLRDRLNAHRSPRDLVRALRASPHWDGPEHVFALEYTSPALDYYAGGPVQVVGDPRALATMYAGDAWTIDRFLRHIRATGPAILICRDGPIPGSSLPPAIERLREAGFAPMPLDGLPEFRIDNGRTPMRAVVVSPRPSP
ncbi:MAG: glycosyltransferase family 39 protein [Phycisphaeraceae bacterium]|nr:glycosyltransferase family 39 protein [Phycisphaeraceae bacterium]